MVQAGRTFRIFVSSTFSDLKEERNALQKYVFPRLRDLCMQHGCRFQAIDLRWGVSEEAGLDQQTMKICLEEIARCQKTSPKPNFIILLGDRYGWQPIPSEIPADEFERILEHVTLEDRAFLLWDEKQDETNKGWYRKDENAVPPVYCLQPRTGDYVKYDNWEEKERLLRMILRNAVEATNLDEKARFKYYASATEQEIFHGALDLPKYVPDARDHVFGFFRSIDNLDDVKREAKHQPERSSLPESEKKKPLPEDFIDTTENHDFDASSHHKLIDLKERLSKRLEGNIQSYTSHWDGKNLNTDHIGTLPENVLKRLEPGESIGDPNTLCVDVWNRLYTVIKKEIDNLEKTESFEQEIAAHDEFGKDLAKFFTGREEILDKISSNIMDFHPVVVHGKSGSGKSALMAKAIEITRSKYKYAVIVSRFIGATPGSSDGRYLLESLCQEIVQEYGGDKSTVPSDYSSLVQKFSEILEVAVPEKPLIIFLDALDQLSINNTHSLNWLPHDLPEHTQIVTSILPDQSFSILQNRIPPEYFLEVKKMEMFEGEKLLEKWLNDTGRALQPSQRKEVINKFELNGLPLYFKLAFEEARRWKSYTSTPALKSDIPGIILDMFARLSSKNNHGEIIVSRCLGYLTAARNGLTEDELIDILSIDKDVFKDFMEHTYHAPPEKKLPVVVWSRLYFDLEPYMMERSADGTLLMSFYHRQLREVAEKEYLKDKNKIDRHGTLAKYFREQTLKVGYDNAPNIRKMSELAYQQTFGELWDDLEETLTDLLFIDAKCNAGMTYDLVEDYNRIGAERARPGPPIRTTWFHNGKHGVLCPYCIAWSEINPESLGHVISCPACNCELKLNQFVIEAEWSPSIPQQKMIISENRSNASLSRQINEFADFVRNQSHLLLRYPGIVFQQAYNWPNKSFPYIAVNELINSGYNIGSWLRWWANKSQYKDACIATLSGHTTYVNSCAYSPDGKKIISCSNDRVKIWDAGSFLEIATIIGSKDYVFNSYHECDFSPDSRRFIVGCSRGMGEKSDIKIFDAENFQEIATLEGHRGPIAACKYSPDGRKILSAAWDKTLKVWDAESFVELATLEGHLEVVDSCNFSPNGRRIISGSHDKTIKIWDTESGNEIMEISVDMGNGVETCAYSPDGNMILSSSFATSSIMLYEAVNGEKLGRILSAETSILGKFAVSPDGKKIALCNNTGEIKICDVKSHKVLALSPKYYSHGESCVYSPDGRRIVSSFISGFGLKIIDSKSIPIIINKECHQGEINSCAYSADGVSIVSSSADDGKIIVWDSKNGEKITSLEGERVGGFNRKTTCMFSPDCTKILFSSFNGKIKIIDTVTEKETLVITGLSDGPRGLDDCTFSPDGHRIAAVFYDGIKIYDSDTGEEVISIKDNPDIHFGSGRIFACKYSPDGRKLITATFHSIYSILTIWDVESGKKIRSLHSKSSLLTNCSYSPDGLQIISSSSSDELLEIWNAENGNLIASIKEDCRSCSLGGDTVCSFSPDGRLIMARYGDVIKIFDAKNFIKVHTLTFEGCSTVTFSPDGNNLCVGSGGILNLFSLEGFQIGPPIITAWLSQVDNRSAFLCPLCSIWSEISSPDIGKETECPNCKKIVILNKFTINADWKKVAKSWNSKKVDSEQPIYEQAKVHYSKDNLDGAMNLHKEEELICGELENKDYLQRIMGYQGLILNSIGDMESAMKLYKEQECICRELGNKEGLQASLGNQGLILHSIGDMESAMKLYKEQESICRELGNKYSLAISLTNQSLFLTASNQPQAALQFTEEAFRIARENGYTSLANTIEEILQDIRNKVSIHPASSNNLNNVLSVMDNKEIKNDLKKSEDVDTWFSRGVASEKISKYEEAIQAYDKALEINPKFFYAWDGKGNILSKMGRYEEAIHSYYKALEINPEYANSWDGRGDVLSKLGRYIEAIQSYDKALEINPGYLDSWYSKGNVLYMLGRYEEAIQAYDKALEINPEYVNSWYSKGNVLYKLGKYEEAIQAYDKALKINPEYVNSWYSKGNVLYKLGKYEEAIQAYDKALEINPKFFYAWDGKGNVLYMLGRYEEAIQAYDKALEINPEYVNSLYNKGNVLYKLGKYEEAIQAYDKTLEINPKYVNSWDGRGNVLSKLGRYIEAIQAYDKTLEINPEYANSWDGKGDVLNKLGRYIEAIQAYDKALEINPKYVNSWHSRGATFEKISRFEEAIQSYDKALEINPKFFYAWDGKGNVLSKLGRYEEAIQAYDKTLEINPEYANSWDGKGDVLNKLGRYIEAIQAYDKALEINPKYVNSWHSRGATFEKISRFEEAIQSYDKALEINPKFFYAWDGEGNVLSNLGRYIEAIQAYDKALEINPEYANSWDGKGDVLNKLGRYIEAIQAYDKALEINPEYLDARRSKGNVLNKLGLS